jgi:hypothetical protein
MDLEIHKRDFEIKQNIKKDNLIREKNNFERQQLISYDNIERENKDFEFTSQNTITMLDRNIVDAKEDLEYFKNNKFAEEQRLKELIESLDKALERFVVQNNK